MVDDPDTAAELVACELDEVDEAVAESVKAVDDALLEPDDVADSSEELVP